MANANRYDPATPWLLRTETGAVYGPAPLSSLCDWAAQARIAPGSRVSPDGVEWVPAEDVPALGMDWMVETAEGRPYGPLNLQAVLELIRDPSAGPDRRIVRISRRRPRGEAEPAWAGGGGGEAWESAWRAELQNWRTRAEAAAREAAQARDELQRMRGELESLRREASGRELEFRERAAAWEADKAVAGEAGSAARRQAESLARESVELRPQ